MKLVWLARQGVTWGDRQIAFLVAGLGVMGEHRQQIRKQFLNWLDQQGQNGEVALKIHHGLTDCPPLHLVMRQGNEADYLIAGEWVRGSYDLPPFKPDLIVDGGANIGSFAIYAHRHFPEARLLCYEPDPSNYQVLEKNLKLNQIPADVHPVGLWDKDITLYYHAAASHIGYIDEQPPGDPIPCVLPEVTENCWLKLDVEGAEYVVLPALFEQQRFPRWITLEIHNFGDRGSTLVTLLQHHGYTIQGDISPHLDCTVITAHRNHPEADLTGTAKAKK